MLKVNLEEILKRYGLKAEIVPADVITAYGEKCYIVITQRVFKHALKGATYKEVIFLNNLASKKSLKKNQFQFSKRWAIFRNSKFKNILFKNKKSVIFIRKLIVTTGTFVKREKFLPRNLY